MDFIGNGYPRWNKLHLLHSCMDIQEQYDKEHPWLTTRKLIAGKQKYIRVCMYVYHLRKCIVQGPHVCVWEREDKNRPNRCRTQARRKRGTRKSVLPSQGIHDAHSPRQQMPRAKQLYSQITHSIELEGNTILRLVQHAIIERGNGNLIPILKNSGIWYL